MYTTIGIHMKIIKRYVTVVLCTLLLSIQCMAIEQIPQANQEESKAWQKHIDTIRQQFMIKGAIMGIWKKYPDGREAFWTGASGDMKADDTFRIASITKIFTASLIMQLVEKKELALNDPISKFGFKVKNADKITIRHLLDHTNGLPHLNSRVMNSINRDHKKPLSPQEVVNLADTIQPNELGKHSYTNTGYIIAGLIIEKITGHSWEEHLKQQITEKYQLTATRLQQVGEEQSFPAWKKTSAGDVIKETDFVHPQLLWSSGMLVSNITDIVRFGRLMVQEKIVSGETLLRMSKPEHFSFMFGENIKIQHGMGLFSAEAPNYTLIGHGGDLPGLSSWLGWTTKTQDGSTYVVSGMFNQTGPGSNGPVAAVLMASLLDSQN